jgi:hypothetical protein
LHSHGKADDVVFVIVDFRFAEIVSVRDALIERAEQQCRSNARERTGGRRIVGFGDFRNGSRSIIELTAFFHVDNGSRLADETAASVYSPRDEYP